MLSFVLLFGVLNIANFFTNILVISNHFPSFKQPYAKMMSTDQILRGCQGHCVRCELLEFQFCLRMGKYTFCVYLRMLSTKAGKGMPKKYIP